MPVAPVASAPAGTPEFATSERAQAAPSQDTVSISPEATRLAAEALMLQSEYGLAQGLLNGLQPAILANEVTDLSAPLFDPEIAAERLTQAEILGVYSQLAAVDTANALVAGALGIGAPQSVASNPAAVLTSAGTELSRSQAYSAYSLLNDFSYRTGLISAIA